MMGLDDRFWYLLLGCLIGFVLGYITRALRDIKDKVQEVEKVVVKHERNENGFMRYPLVADIALLLVLMVTVYAAFASQQASNEVKSTQDRLARITYCNQEFLGRAIDALNERTAYSPEQTKANVELQRNQQRLLATLLDQPPPTAIEGRIALEEYYESLAKSIDNFVNVNGKVLAAYRANPYPTEDELEACLAGDD